ncbi:DUF1127 domain-containing protein [Aestuariivirga sp.]|uniref:DUF1127 domain-containing protein n=1 Tax=Aestuariivirga sp. TaxID=2650926 RepID=UPI003BAA0C90
MRDYALSRAQSAEAVGSFSLLWRLIANWRARRAFARLDTLDDFLLHDIGVTREEVQWAAGLPLSVNAALALEERAAKRRRKI